MRNIRQNLFFAFFFNVVGIPVAAGAALSGDRSSAGSDHRCRSDGTQLALRGDERKPPEDLQGAAVDRCRGRRSRASRDCGSQRGKRRRGGASDGHGARSGVRDGHRPCHCGRQRRVRGDDVLLLFILVSGTVRGRPRPLRGAVRTRVAIRDSTVRTGCPLSMWPRRAGCLLEEIRLRARSTDDGAPAQAIWTSPGCWVVVPWPERLPRRCGLYPS